MGRARRQRVLDLGVAALVVTAAATVFHDRVLPAWRQRAVVRTGEAVDPLPRLLRLDTGAAAAPSPPAALFVFRSDCPACERALPAWRRLARAAPGHVWAVALDATAAERAYALERLPATLPARPSDPTGFLRRFDIRSVPTTLLLDGDGRLRSLRVGPLRPAEESSVLAILSAGRPGEDRRAPRTPDRR